MVSSNILSAPIVSRLKEAGELRIEDFSKERVEFLSSQIDENYEEGIGISSSKLSNIFYGYIQPMYKFEGIAYYAFGLVATRAASNKKGPLFFVRKEDLGRTAFPAIESSYHNYSSVMSAIDDVDWESSSSVSSSDSTEGRNTVVINTLVDTLRTLSDVCSALATTVETLK